jgi:hypothetical protein
MKTNPVKKVEKLTIQNNSQLFQKFYSGNEIEKQFVKTHLFDGCDGGFAVEGLESRSAIEAVAVLILQIRLDGEAAVLTQGSLCHLQRSLGHLPAAVKKQQLLPTFL